MWLGLYAGVFVVTLVLTGILYPRMPEQLAMQYDFAGNVTRTTARTPLAVLFPVIMQFVMGCLFVCIYYMTLNSKRELDSANPEESKKALDIFRNSWAIYIFVVGLLTMGIFTAITLSYGGIIGGQAIGVYGTALGVVATVYALYLSIKIGQGGSRLGGFSSDKIGYNGNDKHWKWGTVYANKEDPAIFVEKRFGIGWTLNFGNPKAIIITIAFVVFMIVTILLANQI